MSTSDKENKAPRPGAGGYRETPIGPLLRKHATVEQIREAHERLRGLFREHHTVAGVSRALGVDRSSVERWLRRLGETSLPDPRESPKAA